MDDELEVIHHQMEETRSALTDKLETLEHQVSDTVEGATEAVAHTVEVVKETVEAVKETFDLRKQVDRHPWIVMTGAVGAGYLAGSLLTPQAHANGVTASPQPLAASPLAALPVAPSPPPAQAGPFAATVEKLKGLAIGGLMSVARELVSRVAPPSMIPELTGVVDDLTTKLGGKPLPR